MVHKLDDCSGTCCGRLDRRDLRVDDTKRRPGVAAGASDSSIQALETYGAALGLAFQIADDVLDVTGTSEALGKTAGRDAALRKSTYASLLGVEAARERAEALVADGCTALDRVGLLTPVLESIAHFVVRRTS